MQRIEERPEATPLMISAITLGEIEFGLQIVQAATPDQETLRTFINTNLRNTAKVALSTLFTRIEQSWRLCSSVKFVGLCIARSSSVPETCNHSQGEFSAIANLPMVLNITKATRIYYGSLRAGVFEKYAPNMKRRRGLRPEQLVDPATSQELGIQENNLWIAAQALEYNLVFVTNDKLERIRDVCAELQIENWAG